MYARKPISKARRLEKGINCFDFQNLLAETDYKLFCNIIIFLSRTFYPAKYEKSHGEFLVSLVQDEIKLIFFLFIN